MYKSYYAVMRFITRRHHGHLGFADTYELALLMTHVGWFAWEIRQPVGSMFGRRK